MMVAKILLNPRFIYTIAILRQLLFLIRAAISIATLAQAEKGRRIPSSTVGRTIMVMTLLLNALRIYELGRILREEKRGR